MSDTSNGKLVCIVRNPNVDFHDYGFMKLDNHEWALRINHTKRIYFDDRDLIVHFNSLSVEALYHFYELVKDGIVTFDYVTKKRAYYLSDEEEQVILEMRKKK